MNKVVFVTVIAFLIAGCSTSVVDENKKVSVINSCVTLMEGRAQDKWNRLDKYLSTRVSASPDFLPRRSNNGY